MINSLKFLPKDFNTSEDPFYKVFALDLFFQDTSYNLALKYSIFLLKFFSFAFYNINFWFKISKIRPKILHLSQISHSTAVLLNLFTCWHPICITNQFSHPHLELKKIDEDQKKIH